MDKLKEFLQTFKPSNLMRLAKDKPVIFFGSLVGVLVLTLVIITVVSAPPPVKTIPAGTAQSIPDPQTQNNTGQNVQQTQSTGQSQTTAPQLPVISWQNINPIFSGPVSITCTTDTEIRALSGTFHGGKNKPKSMILDPIPDENKKMYDEKDNISVTFPLGRKYKSVTFNLSQKAITGDTNSYAYGTVLQFVIDGKPFAEKTITKENLLTVDESVTIPVENAGQLTIKIKTTGKVTTDKYGYKNTEDEYGPFFSIILGGLYFHEQTEAVSEQKPDTAQPTVTSEDNLNKTEPSKQ